MRNISFSPPDVGNEEIEEIIEVIKSGWITTGGKTKEFEKALGEYIGNSNVVALNSQTACAELALRLLGIGPGDEVIVPAYTYTASASVVSHVGATLRLIDCQKNGYEMDYEALREAINENTKAVIPVDLAGIMCDYKRVLEILESKKSVFRPTTPLQKALGRVAICADSAHAFGAVRYGVKCGNLADFTSFSFHAVKNLTTAEGGALVWKTIEGIDDKDIYRQMQLYSLHGQSKDAFAKAKAGSWEYDIEGLWYKCNMTNISAAMGIAQLKKYNAALEKRRSIIEQYDEAFVKLGIEVLPHYADEGISSGHLYMTRIPGIDESKRNKIIDEMTQSGIAVNVHYKPLPMFTAYKQLGFDIKDYPNAYARYKNEITLPLHTCLTQEDVEYIIDTYSRIVKENIR